MSARSPPHQPGEEACEANDALMERLLELEDVDAAYCNQK